MLLAALYPLEHQQLWQALAREAKEHGDVMQLPVEEASASNSALALAFFVAVAAQLPGVRWVVRVGDGALLLPQRLMMAADQWEAAGAE
ncbi:hypothetical protein HYH03_001501 [Edaphochlamys debaryana]|uniref:Uncharacterized protein n=1 Tax=Edaphochlamys debaryana TaxID=47281 RepID=A0A835YFF4_9CHLO|nr:hypothetical protein HYH03_001501 [Edaphochlamys debaryana]|eukprot:KAG2500737.1 hypothetical protein HYH03_001501 [Edaphochlamys debaryana]